MKITFHGAAGEVTGSCTLIETGDTRILVDCGLFQGNHDANEKNAGPFPFDPKSIDAVILTHAHIDHVGRVPKLVREGFKGRIFSSHPTRLFARLMWKDAARVMKSESRRHRGRQPIYENADVNAAFELTHGIDYSTSFLISGGIRGSFHDAGHIFGSSFVDLTIEGKTIVFSGDVGNDYVPILRETAGLIPCDALVMESTYGDRDHEDSRERSLQLKKAVEDIVARKGVLLIPAFSLERTQEILYELNGYIERGELPKVDIFLDSPLAVKALSIYREFPKYYDKEAKELKDAGDDFFRFPGLTITKTGKDSLSIIAAPSPKVIIAGSGMMHGGRIMGHLVQYLEDARNMVLVVGYQSQGTIGRKVLDGAHHVTIEGEDVDVKAEVRAIRAYSAHADQAKLLRWLDSAPRLPRTVFLNHGEQHSSEVLAGRISAQHERDGVNAVVPKPGVPYEI
jgi:metallo-beta-lactamase family protein